MIHVKASRLLLFLVVFGLWTAASATAQSQSVTARAYVPSTAILGMGDAGVALTQPQYGFFYNPAAMVDPSGRRIRVHIIGLRLDGSTNIFDQYKFVTTDLQEAIDRGYEDLNNNEIDELYNDAFALGRQPTAGGGNVMLPNVVVQLKEAGVAIGGGIFSNGYVRYSVDNAGGGVPGINFVGRGDLQALASGAIDLTQYGVEGLTGGLTLKYTKRYLTLKNRPLDAVIEDNIYLLSGQSIGVDLGLLYDLPILGLPGTLRAGVAAYDLLSSDFAYEYDSAFLSDQPESTTQIADEEALAGERYQVAPSFRMGLAFELLELPMMLDQTVFALDYIGYSSPRMDQTALAHLHLGAQTRLWNLLVLRAGLSQGYTTLGLGFTLPFMRINYAFYGSEGGRFPGQLPSWHHAVNLSFGLF